MVGASISLHSLSASIIAAILAQLNSTDSFPAATLCFSKALVPIGELQPSEARSGVFVAIYSCFCRLLSECLAMSCGVSNQIKW